MLDLSSLKNALASLNKAIDRVLREQGDEDLLDIVIHRFEYTYELCWKMLKRRLEADHSHPALVDQMSFKELFREGAERGYIKSVEDWLIFREQRNITSHTYDRVKAKEVYSTALNFVHDAALLLSMLEGSEND